MFRRHPNVPERWFPRDEFDPESIAFDTLFGGERRSRCAKIGADAWFDRRDAGKSEIFDHSIRSFRTRRFWTPPPPQSEDHPAGKPHGDQVQLCADDRKCGEIPGTARNLQDTDIILVSGKCQRYQRPQSAERRMDRHMKRRLSPYYTVLLVEDDDAVRESTAAILREQGFRTLVTRQAKDAIRLLASDEVDVLFADVVLPGITGVELAKLARQIRPEIRILFMTGYYSRAAEAASVGRLMFKPVDRQDILASLNDLLASPPLQ